MPPQATDVCAASGCGRDRTSHTGPFRDPSKPTVRHLFVQQPKPRFKAFVFDLDGTLLDTETLSTRAMDAYVAQRWDGSGPAPAMGWALKKKIIGTRAAEWTKTVLEEYGMADRVTGDELEAGWKAAFVDLYRLADKLPGVDRLLAALAGPLSTLPCAIATSSTSDAVAKKRERHEDLFGRMAAVVTGEMVDNGKPAPDIFLAAAAAIDTPPAECLAFEDTLAGVKSAVAAGMTVVAVPDARMDAAEFKAAGAAVVLASLVDFDATEWAGDGLGLQ